MKKIKVTTLAAATALVAMAGMAQAAPLEYNIFGASAQFDYWKAAAPNFLSQKLGCTAGTMFSTGKHGFIKGTNCTSTLVPIDPVDGKRNIDFRVSGIASGEFVAVGGGTTENPDIVCANSFERKMKANADSSTDLVCKKAHLGASDLGPQSFTQSSSGALHGPQGGALYTPSYPGGINTAVLGISKAGDAFAVPFGLFVNSAVTARHCSAGTNVGDICSADTECGTGGVCNTTPTTINNLSRLQTAMIFSGQVASWADFGPAYSDKQVVACIRHAGSGTAATFDNMVMTAGATGWGAALYPEELVAAPEDGMPTIWYNESTDDTMYCVNGATSATNLGDATIAAVGYADADKGLSSWPNVKRIKFNGNWASATNVKQGVYDWYSIATLWSHPSNTAQNAITNNATNGLIPFVKKAVNIPSSKAAYWVATESMMFKRGNDQAYPARQ